MLSQRRELKASGRANTQTLCENSGGMLYAHSVAGVVQWVWSGSAKLNKTVQRTVLSDKRPECKRRAGRKLRRPVVQALIRRGCSSMVERQLPENIYVFAESHHRHSNFI